MRALSVSRFLFSVGLPVVLFPVTFLLQLKLGYEVSLFPLYMLSIAALSWEYGGVGAIISVVLATFLWAFGNILVDTEYSYEWAIYYNTGVRATVFVLVAYFIITFRRVVAQHRHRMEAMRAMLNVCHGCGSVQGSDGRWIPFDELSVPKARPLCECPQCTKLTAQPGGGSAPVTVSASRVTESGTNPGHEIQRAWQPGDEDRRKHARREEDR